MLARCMHLWKPFRMVNSVLQVIARGPSLLDGCARAGTDEAADLPREPHPQICCWLAQQVSVRPASGTVGLRLSQLTRILCEPAIALFTFAPLSLIIHCCAVVASPLAPRSRPGPSARLCPLERERHLRAPKYSRRSLLLWESAAADRTSPLNHPQTHL